MKSIVCKWSKQPWLYFGNFGSSLLSEEFELIVGVIPFSISILKTWLSVSSEIKDLSNLFNILILQNLLIDRYAVDF